MICDYEGSDYRTRFWENADRAYEDAVERIAIAHMLPPRGARMAEFGAGFGRLADLYAGYDEVILLDYSRSLLAEARQRWGRDPRFKFVAADIYHLPFAPGVLSAATMIRVIHHIADVPAALMQIRRAIAPGGTFVLEFANKRNLKAMMRYLARRQRWNPYAPEPIEFATLNFDFHPRWMLQALRAAGFDIRAKRVASYLRAGFLKRVLPLQMMVRIDAALQRTAALALLSPSVFVQSVAVGQGHEAKGEGAALVGEGIFRSPRSGQPLRREGDTLVCDADGTRWRAEDNFYDFKAPL
ncbi:class I SAM-dependent methyltransferase [Candidatus Roseilinea sp. NK_OTU-006]|jgi:ubiquinone/menaquinone biosynthesis C-methylase UbiE|uniref:class I SAM-dependent methyltransferase n=1 Tax=Candidatus Roseilinea sp. NK_OTU-006 TaxID=2704250 RepID=UPI00145D4841|nr:class I SAM-dependent methyltransferase [Candidatus Roseilinea sp. NK_OTU-006]